MASSSVESSAAHAKDRNLLAAIARFIRRAVYLWTLGVGILVTAIIIGEVSARAILFQLPPEMFKHFASSSQWNQRPDLKFEFSYQTGFGIYPNPGWSDGRNRINSRGFRGDEVSVPKPKGIFRIVCLGGSTTYDTRIENYADAYPAQLQSELGKRGISSVEVVNAGVPGWTSREQILNYVTRVSYLEPDLIVYFDPVNELILRATWPPERFRSDYTSPWVEVPKFADPMWYMSLTLLRVPLILTGRVLPAQVAIASWSDIGRCQGVDNIKRAFEGEEETFPKPAVSAIPSGMTLTDVFAVMPTDYFANNISSIICFAKQRHAMVLLVSGMWDWKTLLDNPLVNDEAGKGLHYGVAQMNDTLAKVAKEQNAFYYDLAGEWPVDSTTNFWGTDDVMHNNEAGARRKAELIADYLVRMNLIPADR